MTELLLFLIITNVIIALQFEYSSKLSSNYFIILIPPTLCNKICNVMQANRIEENDG